MRNFFWNRFSKDLFEITMRIYFYLFFAVINIIFTVPVYFLWNWLMPKFFGLKVATFWEAWGLLFLASFIFKDFSIRKEGLSSKDKDPSKEPERENHPYAQVKTTLKRKNLNSLDD